MNFIEERLLEIFYNQEEQILKKVIFFPLTLISLFYRSVLILKIFCYRFGIFKRERLPCSVISIGNITVGGTGKTTLVQYLAKLLLEKGFKPVILSRGYKSKGYEKVKILVKEASFFSWEETGDEPYLLFKKLPEVPVISGKDRVSSGKEAIKLFSPDCLLLDDGFQYLKLKRDLDIVLIDVQCGFGNGRMLPRGPLREPLKSLERADLILLNKITDMKEVLKIEREVRRWNTKAPIFFAYYRIEGILSLKDDVRHNPNFLKGKKVTALSGIANPKYFHFLIQQGGAEIVSKLVFPDHYHYCTSDLPQIQEKSCGSELIITTEKDGIKLKQKIFENLPLFVLEVALEIDREDEFQDYVFKAVSKITDCKI